jgi:predicted DsbA family dithiol-disulfide isomerase
MKKYCVFFISISVLLFTGCGSSGKFDEIHRRIDNERSKLDELFPEERIVHITTFIDFSDPFSQQSVKILKQLKSEFLTQIDITYKHFLLEPTFRIVSEATECARNQGKFKPYLHSYFERYFDSTDPELLMELALKQDLLIDEFETCIASHSTIDRIALDTKEAKKYRASKAPFFVLNENIHIPGALPEDTFRNLIQKLLNPSPDEEDQHPDEQS